MADNRRGGRIVEARQLKKAILSINYIQIFAKKDVKYSLQPRDSYLRFTNLKIGSARHRIRLNYKKKH